MPEKVFKVKNNLKIAELLLLILMWFVLIASPLVFNENESFDWRNIVKPLETIIPLFILFLINRLLLIPKLLFRTKRIFYFVAVIFVITLLTLSSYYITKDDKARHRPPRISDSRMMSPPPHEKLAEGSRISHPLPKQRERMPPFANFLVFSFLLVGFDTGIRISFRLAETEREKAKLEKENVGSQLAFLKNQISPHFFMNTLNNIHSLIDVNTDEAKESIIQLSKLMRHLLYDSDADKISLKKEIEFIRNYVDLMKLRFSDKVKITLTAPDQLPDALIPPLLFTSFVENAFKHGISYQNSSFVKISFSVSDKDLIFEISNSIAKTESNDLISGIGIENSRKRLALIYGDSYELHIEEKNKEYHVRLNIPL
jgi:two-component sensor histidine kinase